MKTSIFGIFFAVRN